MTLGRNIPFLSWQLEATGTQTRKVGGNTPRYLSCMSLLLSNKAQMGSAIRCYTHTPCTQYRLLSEYDVNPLLIKELSTLENRKHRTKRVLCAGGNLLRGITPAWYPPTKTNDFIFHPGRKPRRAPPKPTKPEHKQEEFGELTDGFHRPRRMETSSQSKFCVPKSRFGKCGCT